MLNPSRETKFSGANADREIFIFPCSADHVQDWQPYSRMIHTLALCDDHHTLLYVVNMHTWQSVFTCVFFTLADRASAIPTIIRGCQSSIWSQRGTEVNGSHHGDNPLLLLAAINSDPNHDTKYLPAPTIRELRELIYVEIMSLSLGKNNSFYYCLSS